MNTGKIRLFISAIGLLMIGLIVVAVLYPKDTSKTILISGMMCDNCVKHVKEALLAIDGVKNADVVIGQAVVTLTKEVSDDSLKASIESSGKYKVTSISLGEEKSSTGDNKPKTDDAPMHQKDSMSSAHQPQADESKGR